jgi:ankyrin repeat protein
MTALMLACANEKEAVAALLMEATQKAGALDVQVNVVWSVWEGLGRWWGQGRGRGERRVGKGTDTCVYVLPQGDFPDNDHPRNEKYQRSALHYASENGLESAVAKLLSLGADAGLRDKVRACSYMNTCMYSVDVCMFVNVLLIRISLSIMHHIFIIVCASHIYIMLVKGIHT